MNKKSHILNRRKKKGKKTVIYDFAVIGGDMRQVYLANYLKKSKISGYHICNQKRRLRMQRKDKIF